MKTKTEKSVEKFNPMVLKNMILFSLRSKRAFTYQDDFIKYEEEETVYEFIVDFFIEEVEKIIVTKPLKSYNEITEDLYYVKGKINAKNTVKKIFNKVNCSFGELTLNNKLNQVIKYIVYLLLKDEIICSNRRIKKRLMNIYFYFEEVKLVTVTVSDLNKIRFNRDNLNYESLVLICRYILGCIKENGITSQKYIDIDSELWWVYQEFIRNYYDYYKQRLGIFSVSPSKYKWNLVPLDDSNIDFLPGMRTDIELNMMNQHIIIDAKCYENSLVEFYGKKVLNSGNLYQLKSYLDIYRVKLSSSQDNNELRGILIYPFNPSTRLNADNQVFYDETSNYTIEIVTIDFGKQWEEVCLELDKILLGVNV